MDSVLAQTDSTSASSIGKRAGVLPLAALLLGGLALSPLQAQTAYFTGTVTTRGGGFMNPFGVAVDRSGNIYVADTNNNAVKEMPAGCASLSCVTTLGGGFSGPGGVAVDASGNIYVADFVAVKEMPPGCASSSCVTTLGGGFSYPTGVVVDGSGNVYVADSFNHAVKEMPPGCTSSSCVTTLGGGFSFPTGVAVDASGNVYVGDEGQNAVKEMPAGCASSSCVTALGGGFNQPWGVAVDGSGNVYAADVGNGAVKKIPPGCASFSCVTTMGGFDRPNGVAVDASGNVYAALLASSVVEIMQGAVNFGSIAVGTTSPALTLHFTFTGAGSGISASVLTQGAQGLDFADAGGGTCDSNGISYVYSIGDACTVNVTFTPKYAGARIGAVELSGSSGAIATAYVHGTGQGPQITFEPAPITSLGGGYGSPLGVAVDGSDNVYVTDFKNKAVKKVPLGCTSSSCVTTLGGGFVGPYGVALDGGGNVYVADEGSTGVVQEIPLGCISSSCVTTLGGGFNSPFGLAVDGSGNVYIADTNNHAVKEMPAGCASSSCVTTLGGGFYYPGGVAVDASGNIYVADTANNAVKEMPPGCVSSSCVTTLGGGFSYPYSIAVDGSGNVYAANTDNSALKEMPSGCTSSSCVTTLGGGFSFLSGVALDGSGNVYVADQANNQVKELNAATPPAGLTFPTTTAVGVLDSTDGPLGFTVQNIGNAPLLFSVPATGFNPSVSAGFVWNNTSTCTRTSSGGSAFSLAPAGSCSIQIGFQPTVSGVNTGAVVLTDNNLNVTGATESAGLSGTGKVITAPVAAISPGSIDFGTLYLGSIVTKIVTVTNTGNAALTISDPFLAIVSGGNSKEFVTVNLCPKSLAAGKSCSTIVSFIAGPVYTPQTATLMINDNAAGSPESVPLSASVINPVAQFSPSSLSFGSVKANSGSSSKTITVSSVGGSALSISKVAITGTNKSDYPETDNCSSGSFNPKATCSITVSFKPTAKGSRTATLVVTDNASNSPQSIPLSGTGN